MGKKSQAAMEFLMTYGWAILVVLVAVGALSYFGVLSPDKFLPSRCSLPAGISCNDHKAVASDSEIRVVLRNGLGFDTTGVTAAVSGCTTSSSTTLNNGDQKTLTATSCSLTGGSKFSGDLNVTYTNSDSGLSHTVQGSITTRVQ
jgi:hypothetical protein